MKKIKLWVIFLNLIFDGFLERRIWNTVTKSANSDRKYE